MPSSPELPEKTQGNDFATRGSGSGGKPCAGKIDAAWGHARVLAHACGLGPLDALGLDRPDDRPEHPSLEWARSGAMSLTGPPNEPPRLAPGPIASAMRGAARLLEALAPRSFARSIDGPGLLGERAAIFGHTRRGDRSPGGSARLLQTATDPLALNLPRNEDWPMLPAWLEIEAGSIDKTGSDDEDMRWARLVEHLRERDAQSLVERGRLMGLAVADAPTAPPQDRPFFRISAPSEIPQRDTSRGFSDPRGRPLRVLDLSTLWAGPLATSLLAEAGLDVLKIENPSRPDGARRGPKAFFDLMNAGKQGCALDLREERDRTHFEQLLEAADVVVESARPRALSQLGFDAESWAAARPGRIWTSITGYGRRHEWIAFGDDAAIAAGLAWSPLPAEVDPCFCGDAIADPLTGLHAAVILLAHLRTGRGGLLDISLRDIAARAATAEHAGLLVAIENREHAWQVENEERFVPVAAPRARSCHGTAPTLTPPDPKRLAAWCEA